MCMYFFFFFFYVAESMQLRESPGVGGRQLGAQLYIRWAHIQELAIT